MRLGIACLIVALPLAGCVFRDAASPRFYRPAASTLDGDAGADPPATASTSAATAVRLEAVSGTPFLRERIAWRSSAVEYGLYEQQRWSETPPRYVQRALESALRATPGLRLTDALDAPVLRVDVVAFDEVLAPEHVARVALAVTLRDRARTRLVDRTFTADTPIAGSGGSATATAMGTALDRVVADVATSVAAAARGS
ncbi:PqiC family protein [Candidatus Binatia bacterium]|nr:PqiC family protein [Candidatus Binatia bacterium]